MFKIAFCIWKVFFNAKMSAVLYAGVPNSCNPSPDGHHYLGTTSVTMNGRTCQAWTSQSPHQHNYNQDHLYSDGSVADAANYCRNPDDGGHVGLWCYTTDPNIRWEACSVPACGQ